jgi:hypothetical protein
MATNRFARTRLEDEKKNEPLKRDSPERRPTPNNRRAALFNVIDNFYGPKF